MPTNRRRIRPGRRYDEFAELTPSQEEQLLTGMAFTTGFASLDNFEAAWQQHGERLRAVARERQAAWERQHGYTPAHKGAFADRLLAALRRNLGLRDQAEAAFRDGGYGRRAAEGLRAIAGDVPARG